MNANFKMILKTYSKDLFRSGFIIGTVYSSFRYGTETGKDYKSLDNNNRKLIPLLKSPYYFDRSSIIVHGIIIGILSAVLSIPLSICKYRSNPQCGYHSLLRFRVTVPFLIFCIMMDPRYDRESKK